MSEPLYYAEGRNIHKRPIRTKAEGGERITIGFRCAVATEEVGEEGAQAIAELMNRGDAATEAVETLEAEAARMDDDATAIHNGTMRGDMKLRAKAFRDAAKIARDIIAKAEA